MHRHWVLKLIWFSKHLTWFWIACAVICMRVCVWVSLSAARNWLLSSFDILYFLLHIIYYNAQARYLPGRPLTLSQTHAVIIFYFISFTIAYILNEYELNDFLLSMLCRSLVAFVHSCRCFLLECVVISTKQFHVMMFTFLIFITFWRRELSSHFYEYHHHQRDQTVSLQHMVFDTFVLCECELWYCESYIILFRYYIYKYGCGCVDDVKITLWTCIHVVLCLQQCFILFLWFIWSICY